MKRLNLEGQKFNKWNVLKFDRIVNGESFWICECVCGEKKSVLGYNIKKGLSKSCGNCNDSKNKFIDIDDCVTGVTNKGDKFYLDKEDFQKISKHTWCKDKNGYFVTTTKQKIIKLHRFIMDCTNPKIFIDHIDHDPSNNRRRNLRLCDNTQNQYNQRKCKKNTSSIYKGVSYDKKTNKWLARVGFNKQRKCIGLYETEMEAVEAYNKEAAILHGEYANINYF